MDGKDLENKKVYSGYHSNDVIKEHLQDKKTVQYELKQSFISVK